MGKYSVPTKVIRTGERVGLIRARLFGAEEASKAINADDVDEVLIFLDAHVEVTKGWLPPLLSEIAADRSRVVVPVIDSILHDTFEYEPIEDDRERGGLDWKLLHFWIGPSDEEEDKGSSRSDAFVTPTMIGCAFAIDRAFFYSSGAYDDKMKIWGGENVEMSVRIWRCGGSLLKSPCSRVGHVYRMQTPHSVPGGIWAKVETVAANTARFAQVWLDEKYLNFYYFMNPAARHLELGDLSARRKLKADLRCHSFQWFLDHVYKDSGFPNDATYVGQIQETSSRLCLDALSTRSPTVGMRVCHGLGGFQTMILNGRGEIRSASRCLEPLLTDDDVEKSVNVTFSTCDRSEKQKWNLQDESYKLIHRSTGLCLTFSGVVQGGGGKKENKMMLEYLASIVKDIARTVEYPTLEKCKENAQNQMWKMNKEAKWDKNAEEIP